MRHTLRQVFRSGKFVVGFAILVGLLLIVLLYPLLVPHPPLQIIGQGTFFPPGIYVNAYDSISSTRYSLNLDDAATRRLHSKLKDEDRLAMKEWLVGVGIPEAEIDTDNTELLLEQWITNYDPQTKIAGMTNARRNYYTLSLIHI